MDDDDLDAWLDTFDDTDDPRPRRPDPDDHPRPTSRRRMLLGLTAVPWVVVAVVVAAAAARGSPPPAEEPPGGTPVEVPMELPVEVPPPTGAPATTPATSPPPPSAPDTTVATASATPAVDVVPPALEGPEQAVPSAHASTAVLAVRRAVTGATSDGTAAYVDAAEAVRISWLGSAAVVEVVALVLTADDGGYDEGALGRWAVPVAADGSALGPPWPLGGVPETPATAPPTGIERAEEVVAALTAAGWSEVTVQASGPTDDLGALVATVTGTPPVGTPGAGPGTYTVWLLDTPGGLQLPAPDQEVGP